MLHKRLVHLILMVAVVLAGLLVGPILADGLAQTLSPSHALAVAPQQEEPLTADAAARHDCVVREVGVFNNRVHVLCWNGAGAIVFFATPTSDIQKSARVLSLLLTAQAAGKRVAVGYDTTADGSAFGCQVANCRPIDYILMLN